MIHATMEHQIGYTDDYELHVHDEPHTHEYGSEHDHEEHVCSSVCDHYHATEHIDLMEPVERHDLTHTHDEAHEHVHGPDCGHVEYQLAHTEIDKPHVHDEHCGHLHHEEATKHIDDPGKDQAAAEHIDPRHEDKEHVHGPDCGHVEYREAHQHIDMPAVAESPVEQGAEEVASSSSGNTRDSMSQTEAQAQSNHEANADSHDGDASDSEPASKVEEAPEQESPSAVESNVSVPVTAKNEVLAQVIERQTDDAIEKAEPEFLENFEEEDGVVQAQISELDTDHQMPVGVEVDDYKPFDVADNNLPADDDLQLGTLEATSADEVTLEMFPEESSDENYPDADKDVSASTEDYDSIPEEEEFPEIESELLFIFEQGTTSETGFDGELIDIVGTSEATTDLSDVPTQELLSSGELSDNSAAIEFFNTKWPSLAEVGSDQNQTRMDMIRTLLTKCLEEPMELSEKDCRAMSDHLIATLQNLPEESFEELLPLLERLTELYQLPKLERLLELYFAGHYQDQGLFTQIFGSATQSNQGLPQRIGRTVLALLKHPKQLLSLPPQP